MQIESATAAHASSPESEQDQVNLLIITLITRTCVFAESRSSEMWSNTRTLS
jgi:hypothetical protein